MSKSLKQLAIQGQLETTVSRRLNGSARGLGYWAARDYDAKRAGIARRAAERAAKK